MLEHNRIKYEHSLFELYIFSKEVYLYDCIGVDI